MSRIVSTALALGAVVQDSHNFAPGLNTLSLVLNSVSVLGSRESAFPLFRIPRR